MQPKVTTVQLSALVLNAALETVTDENLLRELGLYGVEMLSNQKKL
jgi:hypothetical protein